MFAATVHDAMNATRSCDWQPAAAILARSCAHASEADIDRCRGYYRDASEVLLREMNAPEAVWPWAGVEVCIQPLLRAVRLGPFRSTASLGWRTILTGPFRGLLADGDRIDPERLRGVLAFEWVDPDGELRDEVDVVRAVFDDLRDVPPFNGVAEARSPTRGPVSDHTRSGRWPCSWCRL